MQLIYLTNVCILSKINNILNKGKYLNFLFNSMLLIVNATSGDAWCSWWLCRKITEKVPSVTIVLRKYQAIQMPSLQEPHLAREP